MVAQTSIADVTMVPFHSDPLELVFSALWSKPASPIWRGNGQRCAYL